MFQSSSLPLSERLRDGQRALRNLYFNWRFRLKFRLKRCRRAFHYALDTLSAEDAREILYDCDEIAGCHPLLTLTVDDTLEQALEDYHDHPELRRLIADGCSYVGRKWEYYGDYLYEARRWAIDRAAEYAADEGIALVLRALDEPPSAMDKPQQ
jgi:hypothetical protein